MTVGLRASWRGLRALPSWLIPAAIGVVALTVVIGAVVTFTGKVRNHNLGDSVKALTLEHYPGMTEKSLAEIVDQARRRWPLGRVTVIHRIGEMWPGEEIVFVGVTSAHRGSAFAAGEFIMDYLKTRAPFWKREATPEGERWVESRDSDKQAASRW